MAPDELSDGANVDLAFEIQSDLPETRKPEFKFGIEIEPARGLDA